MQVNLVTPEREIFSGDADSVQIPGMEGDMTIMGNHAPVVTTLRPGVLTVSGGSEVAGDYLVTGGFCEISDAGTSILAERAVPRSEASPEVLEVLLNDIKEAAEIAADDEKPAARQRVNDMSELIRRLG